MSEGEGGRKPRRWGLIAPWALFALLVLGWSAYWLLLRQEVTRQFNAWSQAQAAATGAAGFSSLSSVGFPFRLELTAENATLLSRDGGFAATTPQLNVAINPFDPSHVIFSAPEPVRYRLHGGPEKEMTAASARSSLRTRSGGLEDWRLQAEGVRLADPGAQSGGVRIASVTAGVRPDPRNSADWQLSLNLDELRLAESLGGFEQLGETVAEVNAAVVLTQAQTLFAPGLASPLEPWREAGGLARIEAINLTWGGVSGRGQGEAQLDFARRLSGQITLRLTNPQALLGDAGAGAFGPLLMRALESLDATFTARDGALVWQAQSSFGDLGPYRIRDLEPLYEAPPEP